MCIGIEGSEQCAAGARRRSRRPARTWGGWCCGTAKLLPAQRNAAAARPPPLPPRVRRRRRASPHHAGSSPVRPRRAPASRRAPPGTAPRRGGGRVGRTTRSFGSSVPRIASAAASALADEATMCSPRARCGRPPPRGFEARAIHARKHRAGRSGGDQFRAPLFVVGGGRIARSRAEVVHRRASRARAGADPTGAALDDVSARRRARHPDAHGAEERPSWRLPNGGALDFPAVDRCPRARDDVHRPWAYRDMRSAACERVEVAVDQEEPRRGRRAGLHRGAATARRTRPRPRRRRLCVAARTRLRAWADGRRGVHRVARVGRSRRLASAREASYPAR